MSKKNMNGVEMRKCTMKAKRTRSASKTELLDWLKRVSPNVSSIFCFILSSLLVIIDKNSVGLNTKYPGATHQSSYRTWDSFRTSNKSYAPLNSTSAVYRYKYFLFIYPFPNL